MLRPRDDWPKDRDVEELLRQKQYPRLDRVDWTLWAVVVVALLLAAFFTYCSSRAEDTAARKAALVTEVRAYGQENAALEATLAVQKMPEVANEALQVAQEPRTPTYQPNRIAVEAPVVTRDEEGVSADSGWSTARVSVYGEGDGLLGNGTASGEPLDDSSLTFAHRSMPFGTVVTFRYGGQVVAARCNDRGPYVGGRTFDLAPATRRALGIGITVATVEWRYGSE